MNDLGRSTAYRLAAQWSCTLGLPITKVNWDGDSVSVDYGTKLYIALRDGHLWRARAQWTIKCEDVVVSAERHASFPFLPDAIAFMPTLLGMVPPDVVEAARGEMGR